MFKIIAVFAFVALASAAPGFVTETHHHTVAGPAVLTKTAVVDTSASSAITHQSFTNLEKKVPVVHTYSAAAPVVHQYEVAPVVHQYEVAPVVKSVSTVPVVKTVAHQFEAAPLLHTYAATPVVKTVSTAPIVHTYAAAPLVKTVVAAPALHSYAAAPVVHSLPIVHSTPVVKSVFSGPVAYHSYH